MEPKNLLSNGDLKKVLRTNFPKISPDQIWLEDSIYQVVSLNSVRSIYGGYRKRLEELGITKWARNADCDSWALWLWNDVTRSHARKNGISESKAFGIVKFWLDARPKYGGLSIPHMINFFLDEDWIVYLWEPLPDLPNRFEMTETELESVSKIAAW